MQRNYNNRSIEKILNTIKELVDISSNKEKISVDLEITTTDGYTNKIQINKENDSNLSIKKNIIMNDNVAISMDNITKVKILNNNDNPNFKKLLIKEIQDSTIDEENNYRYDPNTGYSRAFSNKLKDKNIEDYIRRNYKDIKNINYYAIKNDNQINSIENIKSEEVLKYNTDLDVNTKKSLENIELGKNKKSVVENITSEKKNVVKYVKIEKKKVLTSNCEEVEVSRPIKTNKIGVLSNINTKNCNVVTNQSKTKVVKELNPNKSTSVIDVKPTYVDNVIKNIDINQQIIKPKTVELMIIGPMNNYLNNEEIKDKPLRMDPTGDGFIGVVLDDGTFEPLKVSLETFTIIPNEAKNILANIESENIENKVINNINIEKDEFVKGEDNYFTATLRAYTFIYYLYKLDKFKNKGIEGVEDMTFEMWKLEDFNSKEEVFEDYFNKNKAFFDTDSKKAVFMIGYLSKKLINLQATQEGGRKPFMSNLNGLNLTKKDLVRLLPKIQGKFMEYKKEYYNEELLYTSQYLINSNNLNDLSNLDIPLYFSLGMNMVKKFDLNTKEEEVDNDNE